MAGESEEGREISDDFLKDKINYIVRKKEQERGDSLTEVVAVVTIYTAAMLKPDVDFNGEVEIQVKSLLREKIIGMWLEENKTLYKGK